jgi:predicted lipid-binding transport protein (Tim44 family)
MRREIANRLPVFLAVFALVIIPDDAFARGGGGCLEAGTPILTPRGPVAIARLHEGDIVWTILGGNLQSGTVQARIEVEAQEFLELSIAGRTLRVTPEHPFQIAPGTFCLASCLKSGDLLYIYQDGHICPIRLISVKKAPLTTHHSPLIPSRAYNLLVTPGGTYLADGIVVHNKGCFLPDTQILKADRTSILISQVRPGDHLLSFAPDGQIVDAVVQKVRTHEVKDYIVVTTEQMVLRVTPEHPFYVGNGTFRTLESLKVGDKIFAFDGQGLSAQTVVRLERVHARTRVYNLQTDQPHTFFANGIAVHNKGGGGGGGHGGGGFHSSGGFHSYGSRSSGSGSSGASELPRENLIGACAIIGAIAGGMGGGFFGARGALRNPPPRGLTWWFTLFFAPLLFGACGALLGFVAGAVVGFGIALCLEAPGFAVFAIFVLVWLVAAAFKTRDKKDEDLDFAYSPEAVAPKTTKTKKLLDFLARQDSTMAAEKLQETARTTFCKLQECWQARDYGPMKPLLMPDLYAQHCSQLAGMKRNHEINMIADLAVERVDIVNLRYMHKADQREFTALISARGRDYYVDDRDQKFLRGDSAAARFQEFWTFQLQSGAWLLREVEQSRESDKLKEENFVEMFTDKQVESVYAETASPGGPAGPWLEKNVETKASRTERLLNFLVQTDKMWNRKQMLERARQVFLDVLLAQEAGDPAPVKTDELFPDVADHLKADIQGRREKGVRLEFRNLCVRKVELILVRNYADNAKDEFTVRISAHAQKIVSQNERTISREEYVTPFEQFWTFGRLDRQWKLKEILPPLEGQQLIAQENVDEESDPSMLQWFYTKSRAG